MSFDAMLEELMETRLRYEILRGNDSSRGEVAAARSRLHELRSDLAFARLHR